MYLFSAILVFLFIGSYSKKSTRLSKKTTTVLAILPLFFMTAFRHGSMGNDTANYINTFSYIAKFNSLTDAVNGSRMEAGYVALNYICSHLGMHYLGFQIVVTIIIYCAVFYILYRYSENVWFSMLIFLTLRYAIGPMNTVRNWLAIAVLLLSLRYLIENKLFKFFIAVGVASLFHTTAIIFLLIYPFSKLKLSKKRIAIIWSCAVVILIAGMSFFTRITNTLNRYNGYLTSDYFTEGGNIATLLTLALDLFLFMVLWWGYKKQEKIDNLFSDQVIARTDINKLWLYTSVFVVALDIIGLGNTIMSRVSCYFSVFYIVSIPNLIASLTMNKRLIKFTVIVILVIQFFIIMLLRPQWNGVTPFMFYWE
ncbi:MAG: EpsG family protein [Eubacteriales bacterium]|nr:EpsG family protein [Eubacteriales bacterium]